ncbi:hypothetical protein FACS1894147_07850 [Spirochaetia bacterium]|nr:hypothetical protein FACS1894147_07850 [Spirochaetia bacterium]
MKRNLFVLGIFLFLVFLGACSRTEPRIVFGVMELVYYQGETGPEERFSFFVIPEDDDGVENLDEMLLYHDREGLRWSFGPGDWISYEAEGSTWIGSRSIAMQDNGVLPRGQYRAVLVNKGGERAERNFTFDAPPEPRFPFPALSVSDGVYRIDSSYPENRFICYDAEGNFLMVKPLDRLEGPVADLGLASGVRGVALWAVDASLATSALTDVAPLR